MRLTNDGARHALEALKRHQGRTALSALAQDALDSMERGKRDADGIGAILVCKYDAPGWVRDLCLEATSDNAPHCDWTYEFIGDALSVVSEHADEDADEDDLRERFDEWADGSYVYTREQTAWFAGASLSRSYCDEAADEYGHEGDIDALIRLGMFTHQREVFYAVLAFLAGMAEDAEA